MQAYLDETDFYKMVIVVNTELTMGTGKVSAQVAQAAIGGVKFTMNNLAKYIVKIIQQCSTTITRRSKSMRPVADTEI